MKQAAIWLIPAVALTTIGSLTYASNRPIGHEGTKRHEEKVLTKIVPFPHDQEISTYLTSIRSFMLTPPRDGRFGASRIPTFHGVVKNKVPGYNEVEALTKEFSFASYVVGEMPKDAVAAIKQYESEHPDVVKNPQPNLRITSVHRVASNPPKLPNNSRYPTYYGYQAALDTKSIMDKAGYDTYSEKVTIDGNPGWIIAKAVRASDKSCYSCHATIKEGEPIGHVVAAIWKKESK